MNLASVNGVEVFAAGVQNGQLYTTQDLDQIVANFDRLQDVLRPPIVIGHDESGHWLEDSGYPAAGRVVKLRRDGNVLLADFDDVPQSIAKLINGRAYTNVSAEIYDDFVAPDGRAYGKTLRRVALLGGELPAVKTLADLPWADYSERPQRRATLVPTRSRRYAGTVTCFSEVRPMSAAAIGTPLRDQPNPAGGNAPVPQPVDRDKLVMCLSKFGLSPDLLGDAPDDLLTELVRILTTQKQNADSQAADLDQQQQMAQASEFVARHAESFRRAGRKPAQVLRGFAESYARSGTSAHVFFSLPGPAPRPKIAKHSEQPAVDANAELQKVRRFAESDQGFRKALAAAGKKPSDYVEGFKKAQQKIPDLTAAQYGAR